MDTTALLWSNPPAEPVKRSRPLECHRCRDCLTVAFSDLRNGLPSCGICSGAWEHQGSVDKHGLYEVHSRTACDERCTGAAGKKCECQCGGENHGTGATIEYRVGLGNVPKNAKSRDILALRARVSDWRSRCEALRLAVLERCPSAARKPPEYLSQGDYYWWRKCNDVLGAIREAHAMKSWHGRESRLAAVKESILKME